MQNYELFRDCLQKRLLCNHEKKRKWSSLFLQIWSHSGIEDQPYIFVKKTDNFYDPAMDVFLITMLKDHDLVSTSDLADFLPLEGYEIGEDKKISVSVHHHIPDS